MAPSKPKQNQNTPTPSMATELLVRATEILKNSGFVKMSAFLESRKKTLSRNNMTIFALTDSAFKSSLGQHSPSVLRSHVAPSYFSSERLKSLPSDSKVQLCRKHHLVKTSSPSDEYISMNGVKIKEPPVFDDGSLIIYGVDAILDPNFGGSADPIFEIAPPYRKSKTQH